MFPHLRLSSFSRLSRVLLCILHLHLFCLFSLYPNNTPSLPDIKKKKQEFPTENNGSPISPKFMNSLCWWIHYTWDSKMEQGLQWIQFNNIVSPIPGNISICKNWRISHIYYPHCVSTFILPYIQHPDGTQKLYFTSFIHKINYVRNICEYLLSISMRICLHLHLHSVPNAKVVL